ncbi:YopX family protein [Lachnospiraceae bacterium EP-SM-12S-S03]|nr:YopX family protein [Lachnospiraceae bacterium EP-SM-12S-S03]
MRKILFKAKRKDNGKWVEGYLMDENYINVPFDDYDACGRFDDPIEIDPDTICQFTGLTDKNDKKIWENDILRYSHEYEGSPFLKEGEDVKYRVGAVFWSEWRGSWAVCGRGKKKCINNDVFKYNRNPNRTEVIGNVFDNPELLEVE